MADNTSTIKEHYSRNLKALDYAETLGGVFQDVPDLLKLTMQFFKNVLESGRFQGSKLLEIGSGALVHNIASASAFFPNIIMSDYVEDNCQELRRWLGGQSPVKQFLHATAELEGFKGNLQEGEQAIETRIRRAVRQVVRCDVTSDDILLEDPKPEVAPPYDLVVSSLCLESSVPDLGGLVQALRRISRLLRPGGGLVLVGFLGGKRWKCGGTDFHYVDVTQGDVLGALAESGFGNVDMKTEDQFKFWYEHDQYYFLSAERL